MVAPATLPGVAERAHTTRYPGGPTRDVHGQKADALAHVRHPEPTRERAIRIGCSGWSYRDWREPVYRGAPPARWLARYAELFDTVEVNSTFYRLARETAVARWAAETPPGFTFTVKASRYLTHVRRLQDLGTPLERFRAPLAPLGAKLGPTLWQLPPDLRRDDDRLAGALARLPPGRHAFEFRHPSWFAPEVLALLRAHGAALVIAHDGRAGRVSSPLELTAPFTLLRFHFGARGRGGNYSERELREWAARVRDLATAADVFAYFNNDWGALAVRNALRLRALVSAGG